MDFGANRAPDEAHKLALVSDFVGPNRLHDEVNLARLQTQVNGHPIYAIMAGRHRLLALSEWVKSEIPKRPRDVADDT